MVSVVLLIFHLIYLLLFLFFYFLVCLENQTLCAGVVLDGGEQEQ